MSARGTHDDIALQAALYALGCLSGDEAASFEAHVASCPTCMAATAELEETASALASLAPEAGPPAELRGRLLDRVAALAAGAEVGETQSWKNWAPSPAGGVPFVVRGGEGRWQPTGVAGVSAKALFVDPANDRVTMLVRMRPGATYPAHRHGGPEESFVLEGDLTDGEVVLRAGDYLRKDLGTLHGVQSTERGCLMLIVSSLHDELAPAAPSA